MTVTTTTEPGAPARVPVVSAPAGRSPRRRRSVLPYALILPTVVVLTVILGYPVARLIVQSGQEYGMSQVFGAPAPWVGFDNFRRLFGDPYFWKVLRRTLVFCFVNVALTMSLGVLIALLLNSLGSKMRLLVSTSLILAWAMPALTATVVWQWIFDSEYGLANWVFDRQGESWLADPMSFFGVATIIVVWMGIPFVAFTVYAGPDAGSRRPARGRQPRRRRRRGAVPLHHRPDAQADPDDPHRVVDAVGLPGVHPDLRAPAGRRNLP